MTDHSDVSPAESGRRQVFRAAGLVAALALFSRLLGLVREMVVRQYLGVTTLEATAFDIAARFPEAIFLIVAGGAQDHVGVIDGVRHFVAVAAQTSHDQLAVEHVHLAADGFEIQLGHEGMISGHGKSLEHACLAP